MFDYAERYGHCFVKLTDSRATEKEFEFDQMLLMPTAKGRRALVEQAKVEIDPRVMRRLSKVWSESTISFMSPSKFALRKYLAMGGASAWREGFLFAQIASCFPGHRNRKSPMEGSLARAFRAQGPA
ncbi:MAG TPA: hypothetical protein PLX30_10535 [Methanothrix sp.]|nr:hypothetical protein [Methanothrix sp.]